MEILSIKAFRASTYGIAQEDEIRISGDNITNELYPNYTTHFSEIQILDEVDILTVDVHKGSPWHIQDVLSKGDRLIIYIDSNGDGAVDEWRCYRIRNINKGSGENSEYKIEAWSIDVDFTTKVWGNRANPSSTYRRTFDFVGFTVEEVLREFFAALPSVFRIGTVHSSIAMLEVSPFILNNTVSECIGVLRETLEEHERTLEYEITFHASNEADPHFIFDFYHERGWNDDELTADAPDPSLRVIAADGINSNDEANRLGLQVQDVQDDYVSRLIPVAGTDEEPISIGGVEWGVSRTEIVNQNQTIIYLEDEGVIAYRDQFSIENTILSQNFNWCVRGDDGNYYDILRANPPLSRFLVRGDASALTTVVFVEKRANNVFVDVDYIRDSGAERLQGVSERIESFPNVIPYPNLIEEAGGTGDLSEWTNGLPDGFVAHGEGVTITQNNERMWTTVGKYSAKVEADTGKGIKASFMFGDDPINPYASASAVLQVEQGSVRMWMQDSEDVTFPLEHEQQHEGLPGLTAALKLGGFDPAPGLGVVYIEAKTDDTIFYLDSIAVTQSPTAWDYAPYMGPKELWIAGVKWMLANGGIRPITTQARYINLDYFGRNLENPIKLGSWCRIKDFYDHTDNPQNFHLQLDGRVERLEHTGSGTAIGGGSIHVATIGQQRESIIDMLQDERKERPPVPEFPLAPLPIQELVSFGDGIKTWQHENLGVLRYTPPEPRSRVTRFRVAIAAGEGLPTPGEENWQTLLRSDDTNFDASAVIDPPDAGHPPYYQTTVELTPKHLSWIRYEIQIDNGEVTPIVGEVVFDFDTVPTLYDLSLDWLPLTRDVRVRWLPDEDTSSVAWVWGKSSVDSAGDDEFDDAVTDGDFSAMPLGRQEDIEADLKPGETFYIKLRPFSVTLERGGTVTGSRVQDGVTVAGEDVQAQLRIPKTGDLPVWELDHNKAGSTLTLYLRIFDPTADEDGDDGLVERVDVRTAMGRPIRTVSPGEDAYSTIPDTNVTDLTRALDGVDMTWKQYTHEINISTIHKHNSYVQFKIVTVDGVDDIVLQPFVVDPDNQPEATIAWDYRWDEENSNWDFIIAWAGDDDLQSIEFEMQIPPTTDTNPHRVRSNLTQSSNSQLRSDIPPNTEWRMVVKGWSKDNGWDPAVTDKIENTILIQTGKTPPGPGEIDFPVIARTNVEEFQDRIDLVEARFREIAEAASNWSTEDIEFSSELRVVSWTGGTITIEDNTAETVTAGMITIPDHSSTEDGAIQYFYFTPGQSTIQSSANFDTATANNSVVVAIASMARSKNDAVLISIIGNGDNTENIDVYNLRSTFISSLFADIGVFSALSGVIRQLEIDGEDGFIVGDNWVIDASGIFFERPQGTDTDFVFRARAKSDGYKLIPEQNYFVVQAGSTLNRRFFIGKQHSNTSRLNGPFDVLSHLRVGQSLRVKDYLIVGSEGSNIPVTVGTPSGSTDVQVIAEQGHSDTGPVLVAQGDGKITGDLELEGGFELGLEEQIERWSDLPGLLPAGLSVPTPTTTTRYRLVCTVTGSGDSITRTYSWEAVPDG